jgi:hypothetical protein
MDLIGMGNFQITLLSEANEFESFHCSKLKVWVFFLGVMDVGVAGGGAELE